MKKLFSNPLFHLAFVLFLVLGFEGYSMVGAQYASPASQPPYDASYPPLDTGSVSQIKSGSLYIGDSSNNVGLLSSGALGFTKNGNLQSYILYNPNAGEPVVYNRIPVGVNGYYYATSTLNSGWDYGSNSLFVSDPVVIGTVAGTSYGANLTVGRLSTYALRLSNALYSYGQTFRPTVVLGSNEYWDNINGWVVPVDQGNPMSYIKFSDSSPAATADFIFSAANKDVRLESDGTAVIKSMVTAGDIRDVGTSSAPDTVVGTNLNLAKSSMSSWGQVWVSDDQLGTYNASTGYYEKLCPGGYFMTGIRFAQQSDGEWGWVFECHQMFPPTPSWF